jgi:hypothetical protein
MSGVDLAEHLPSMLTSVEELIKKQKLKTSRETQIP